MIQYGLITEFRYITLGSGKKLEVKVSVDDRVTNWLPVKTQASSFLVVHTPVRINDQVIVFNPFGNNEDGFVDRNLTYKSLSLPNEANEDTYISVFEDGTIFTHNTKTKKIDLTTPCDLTLDVNNLTIKAKSTKFIGGTISHDGIDISKTHNHPQNAGNHFGGGTDTSAPNGL
jgi:phage baseplate assembly protein gpV